MALDYGDNRVVGTTELSRSALFRVSSFAFLSRTDLNRIMAARGRFISTSCVDIARNNG
jgi:hypothetical protein